MPTLTRAQRRYLAAIVERGRLSRGWGGYRATPVVRRLEELGLCRLCTRPGGLWEASPTDAGRREVVGQEGR